MFKAAFLIALAFGVASAQRWPMITVNSAGEIVLQSLTRAQSFQITPAAVTTTPSTSGTASAANAAPLAAGVSAFVVTTNASPLVGGHGVALPAPSVGAQVTLIQSQTTFVSYTIWASTSSVFINTDATTTSITALSRRVVCTSISTTRWNCIQDAVDTATPTIILNPLTYSATASVSLSASDSGRLIAVVGGTATFTVSVTLPACTSSTVGVYYDWVNTGIATTTAASTLSFIRSSADVINGHINGLASDATTATGVLGSITGTIITTQAIALTTGAPSAAVTGRIVCASAGYWVNTGTRSAAAA
jgi:hypothetical protein